MNDVKLEVKGTELDLPIFRRPELSLSGDRTPMMEVHYIVIRDEDYQTAVRKLLESKFVSTVPDNSPPFEVTEHLPDPQGVLKEINEGYRGLGQSFVPFIQNPSLAVLQLSLDEIVHHPSFFLREKPQPLFK